MGVVHVGEQDESSDNTKLRILGGQEPASDVAAMLRARFVEGKSIAVVLQVPGQVQGMSASMTSDFNADLKALSEESKVQIHKGWTSLWITGTSVFSVRQAKRTLQEMLHFYLPGSFILLRELQADLFTKLFADEDIGALMARPDCVVAFDAAEGTAWICGKHIASVRSRIDELTRDGQTASTKRRTDMLADLGEDVENMLWKAIPRKKRQRILRGPD